jgi:hypothetical protein
MSFMNTNYLTALGTGPLYLLASDKMSYPVTSNVYKIFNPAHTIIGSITFIQVDKIVAREGIATEAVLNFSFSYFFTVLTFARDTGFGFETVITSATGTCLYMSYECSTETTVHSARGDQRYRNRIRLLWLSLCHFSMIAFGIKSPKLRFIWRSGFHKLLNIDALS